MFGINLYYSVIISWCACYMLFCLKSPFPWAANTDAFFNNDFLQKSTGVMDIGGVSSTILVMSLIIWFIMWVICARRIEKGVEIACKIFMPLLFLLTTTLVIWGITLPGASEGIRQYLHPNWAKLGEVQVWRDAFGQSFFSLSLGFGIMIAYASYLPRKVDLVRNAFITALSDSGYSIFAGFSVFAILGYMAQVKGVPVSEVTSQGLGLCFVAYPEAISQLPALNNLFGVCFFLTLVLAGMTSAISIVEAFAAAAVDKFGWRRGPVVTVICILGFLGSSIFTTHAGIFWLDIVDHCINSYGLIIVGLLECLFLGWYYGLDPLHQHIDTARGRPLSKIWTIWWEWSVKFVAPIALLIITIWTISEEIATPYEGYPVRLFILIGLGWILGTFLIGGLFSVYTRHVLPIIVTPEEEPEPETTGD